MEHGEPLGDDDGSVPASLVELTRMWTRGRELRPVATLSTERTVYRLLGDGGTVLAEAADDVVNAEAFGADGAVLSSWREWEIELVDGPVELLDAAGPVMLEAGAGPSACVVQTRPRPRRSSRCATAATDIRSADHAQSGPGRGPGAPHRAVRRAAGPRRTGPARRAGRGAQGAGGDPAAAQCAGDLPAAAATGRSPTRCATS